jgi:hypothetical protein
MKSFKKGDAVICDDYGIGYVIEVSKDIKDKYPISVEFQSDNSVVDYTIDGRSVINSDITLHHDDHDWMP